MKTMLLWTLPETSERPAVRRGGLTPPADVTDDGESYRLFVEMPGVRPDSVVLDLEGQVLTVRGERAAYPENQRLLYSSRFVSRPFERHFTLGADIDRAQVSAKLENGVLLISVPRRAEDKARRIEVDVKAS